MHELESMRCIFDVGRQDHVAFISSWLGKKVLKTCFGVSDGYIYITLTRIIETDRLVKAVYKAGIKVVLPPKYPTRANMDTAVSITTMTNAITRMQIIITGCRSKNGGTTRNIRLAWNVESTSKQSKHMTTFEKVPRDAPRFNIVREKK